MSANQLSALYVQPAVAFGGAERQAATNLPLLARQGIDVTAVVGPGTDLLGLLAERGIDDYVHAPAFDPEIYAEGLSRLTVPGRYVWSWARSAALIADVARQRAANVMFAALPFGWIAATPAARKLGIPIVWRAGGTEMTTTQRVLLHAALRVWRPDFLVCCSQAVRCVYEPIINTPAEVVLNGVDSDWFTPEAGNPAMLRPPGARVVVGFAARMAAQKRPNDFVHLAARLSRRFPDVACIAAGDGPLRSEAEARARALGASNLRFVGYVEDMASLYRACDIFVLPSRSEGAPNTVLEAMATRRPVVVTDVPGTREIVRDERDGLVFPIGDVDALEAQVARLIESAELRDAIAGAALGRVRREFSARACAARTAELLQAVTGGTASAEARGRTPRRSRPSPPTGSREKARAAARGARSRRRGTRGRGR